MSVQTVDYSTAAMQASAEGQMALVTGDVVLAKAKYAEAGDYLRRDIARLRKAPKKHLQQFLAATQYYKGGHYQRAYDMAKRIEARFLPDHVGELLSHFLKDAKARSAPDYEKQTRILLYKSWAAEKPAVVLALLQEHPYLLDSGGLSFMRAVSCEKMGHFRAAALYYKAALRHVPSEIELLAMTIACPLDLATHGRLPDASEYSGDLVELVPHPITFITASIVGWHQAQAATSSVRENILKEQMEHLTQAWDGYEKLSDFERQHRDMQPYMAFGLVAGAHTAFELGDLIRSKQMCDLAIRLAPNTPGPWTIRGLVTEPSDEAISDFRKAISLPDAGHVPYAKLAQDTWRRRDFPATMQYCEAALARNSKSGVAGTLYGWIAACKSVLGSPHNEVDALYRKSLALDPDDTEIRLNYKSYLERSEGVDWHPKLSADLAKVAASGIVQQSETQFSNAPRTRPNVDRILQPA